MKPHQLYRSRAGKIQTGAEWEKEAWEFYKDLEGFIKPKDWWERWTRVLKLELHKE